MGLSGAEIRNENEKGMKKLNAVTHAVEQIYYARNLNIITPFAFKRNLITYSLTHSKTAVKLYGSLGSYATVTDMLLQQSDELKYPTDADVISTIDNNQKVGKCGRRIKEGSKVAISICTTVGHIKPNPECYLQREQEFAPENWLGKLASNELGK